MFIDRKVVEKNKKQYPVGSYVLLNHMGDDPRPIPDGSVGRVECVDDIGTVHCTFADGRMLGLISLEDSFCKIETKKYDVTLFITGKTVIRTIADNEEEAKEIALDKGYTNADFNVLRDVETDGEMTVDEEEGEYVVTVYIEGKVSIEIEAPDIAWAEKIGIQQGYTDADFGELRDVEMERIEAEKL